MVHDQFERGVYAWAGALETVVGDGGEVAGRARAGAEGEGEVCAGVYS